VQCGTFVFDGASVAGGALRQLLDENAALLAVYLDVPLEATSRIGAASYR
jgi:hypothetical protein